MYLFSIPQLHEAVRSTGFYQNKKKQTDKDVLLDKCNWLIHSIAEQNRKRKGKEGAICQPVPLSKDILKRMLGTREYRNIRFLLEGLGYITVDDNYTSTSQIHTYNKQRISQGKAPLKYLRPECKKYNLTDKAVLEGIEKVGILTSRMRSKIRKYKSEKIKGYSRHRIHSKILNSITKVKFNPDHPKALKALQVNKDTTTDKGKYYHEVYQELQELGQHKTIADLSQDDAFYYTQSENVNRVFHYYATIPKDYRESLELKNGGKLSEIDLKNSQPLIIALNYLKANKYHLNKADDHQLLSDVLSGKFYKAVANQALKNDDGETYNLYTENYSKFKAQVLGQGLYFNYIPEIKRAKPTEQYLMQLYPNFMTFIRNKKRTKGYKIVSIEAQQIESSIFIEGLYNQIDKTDIAIPVHDSVIIPVEKESYYLEKLTEIFKAVFPFMPDNNVRSLFRITEY